jgi:hypothetical protein
MAAVWQVALLGHGYERVGRCAPQLLRRLEMVSGFEFPVRGRKKFPGGPDVIPSLHIYL